MSDKLRRDDVDRALSEGGAALSRLVSALTPIIQARVARSLLLRRSGLAAGRDVRQEVEDLTQEVFLILFAEGGKVLLDWAPERGLSLPNFVGLVAERRCASILRSGKRSPWKEDPTLDEDLDETDDSDPEAETASRMTLRKLLRRLTEELSPLGRQLFELLFLRELSVAEVSRQTQMSADAVYAWRSRLRRLARRLRREMSEQPGEARNPQRMGDT